MNEKLQQIRADEDRIRTEADGMYEKWQAALAKFGHRDDYWKRVMEQAGEFDNKYEHLGRGLMVHRVEALEEEWRELHPPKNGMMEEVFGNG